MKYLYAPALFAFLMIGAWLSSLPWECKIPEPQSKTEQTASYYQDDCQSLSDIPLRFLEVIDRNDKAIVALSTIFIAIFTIVLGISTVKLWKSTDKLWLAGEKQIRAAKSAAMQQAFDTRNSLAASQKAASAAKKSAETLVATERARLFIVVSRNNLQQDIEFLCRGEPDRMNEHGEMRVIYSFKNYGKTPAIIKETSHFLIKAVEPPDEPLYFPVDIVESEFAISYDKNTKDRPCFLDPSSRLNQQEAIAVFNSRTTLWFFGRVVYDDVLGGKDHEHRFLWKYNGGSHGFRPCYDYPEYIKNT